MSDAAARTHATRALIELRRRILSGELAGGKRLFEVPLAEALAISRTPVREALVRLAEEGLLDRVSGGGFVVRTFLYSDALDAIELRGVLEGTAARLAAERGADPEGLERMRAIVAELDACCGKAGDDLDFEGYSDGNARFHRELAALAGSPLIAREIERVVRLPFASPTAFVPDKAFFVSRRRSLDIAQAQHRGIVEAIAAREGTRAEHLAREHARLAREDLELVLGEHRDLIARMPGLALVLA